MTNNDKIEDLKHKLISLQMNAKQLLLQSEEMLKQANKQTKSYAEQYGKRSYGMQEKLQIIFAEIQKQLGVIKRLVAGLSTKNNQLLEAISGTIKKQTQILNDLKTVLVQLQQKPLHNSLIASSQISSISQSDGDLQKSSRSSTSLKKTLYDFVNIDSVNAILNQAEIEIKEMKNIENLGKTILNAVEEQYNDITKSSDKLTQDMEKVNKNPIQIDPNEMNQTEIRAIGKLVLEIAGFHDRIQHILDNPTLISSVDISGIHVSHNLTKVELEAKSKQLPDLIRQIQGLMKKIQATCTEVESIYKQFSNYYTSAVTCYSELEKMAPLIPDKVVQIDELETLFFKRITNSQLMFEEIGDLTTWYKLFQKSYNHMLLEIYRRQKEHERQQAIVDEFVKKMNQMYITESNERQKFYNEYGRYLPATLCPSIMESATKYTVSPETYKTALSSIQFTEDEIEEIKKQCQEMDKQEDESKDKKKEESDKTK